jgi:hypothetical protein
MTLLDNLQDFLDAVHSNLSGLHHRTDVNLGELYCPKCGGNRRMKAETLYSPGVTELASLVLMRLDKAEYIKYLIPSLFHLTCVQCDTGITALVFKGPGGPQLALFPSVSGGISTPHPPKAVSYYLDQAQRSQTVAANSAAVAMYRGALDQLLYHEGFRDGMLGNKLQALEKKILAGTAPKWAMELETEYLTELNHLGSGSIHPNDGDITKQQLLDNELLEQIGVAFSGVLYLAYEVPHDRQQRLGVLKSRAQLLKK